MKYIYFNIIIILHSVFSYVVAIDFNRNTIVSIVNETSHIECEGIIIADKIVLTTTLCYMNHTANHDHDPILKIKYKEHEIPVIYKQEIVSSLKNNLLLLVINSSFDLKDIGLIVHSNDSLPLLEDKYYNINCINSVFLYPNNHFPTPRYQIDNDHLTFEWDWKHPMSPEHNWQPHIDTDSIFNKQKFIWTICHHEFTLAGIYMSDYKYLNLSYQSRNIYKHLINFIAKINDQNIGKDHREILGFQFVDLPKLSNEQVNAYINHMKHTAYYTNKDGMGCVIPFERNNFKSPCGTKYQLMLIFLYDHPEYNMNFVGISFECKVGEDCFYILGSYYTDHIALAYKSIETNEVMVVDPTVSAVSVPLNKYYPLIMKNIMTTSFTYIILSLNFWRSEEQFDGKEHFPVTPSLRAELLQKVICRIGD